MTLGLAERQGDLLDDVTRFCSELLAESSVYSLLHRERDRLFPDEFFADLFCDRGRRSVPPSVVATVMVLQRLEGLSDREAVERYTFDTRWRYAAGVGGYDCGGRPSFAHTVLVDMRERLRRSGRPDRVFEVGLEAAKAAGLVGRRRVLDSTPLYDAVATMDTVTLIRSAVRGLLAVADDELEAELRRAITSGDDYATSAKPQIDWDDRAARDELIDSRAKDAFSCLAVLDGRELDEAVAQGARLVATVLGQDLEEGDAGVFRIARRVAPDRVISTVDTDARHGHKTAARGYDGYKGHAGVDPDSEIITATKVTPANAGDASVAEDLIADLIDDEPEADDGHHQPAGDADTATTGTGATAEGATAEGATAEDATDDDDATAEGATAEDATDDDDATAEGATADDDATAEDATAEGATDEGATAEDQRAKVYGDAAYGTGAFQAHLEDNGIDSGCKTQPPSPPAGGLFAKSQFRVDLQADNVSCPAGVTVPVTWNKAEGIARFGDACADCPLRPRCTTSPSGRTIRVSNHEAQLARARARQADPRWQGDYRATRPKVERKLAHMMRRKHGGRRARMRGTAKIDADFRLLAAATNLARLAVLGLRSTGAGWSAATP